MFLLYVLATAESSGGLFDFNATLPFMAIQYIFLTLVLTFIFYNPIAKLLDKRETEINENSDFIYKTLIEANFLEFIYDQKIQNLKNKIARNKKIIIERGNSFVRSEILSVCHTKLYALKRIKFQLESLKLSSLEILYPLIDDFAFLICKGLL
jgi:F-type H+-transporting ATPase subunit b